MDKKNFNPVVAVVAVVVLVLVVGAIYKLTMGKGAAPEGREVPEGQPRPGMGPEQPGAMQDPAGGKAGKGESRPGMGPEQPGAQQDTDADEASLMPAPGAPVMCRSIGPLPGVQHAHRSATLAGYARQHHLSPPARWA